MPTTAPTTRRQAAASAPLVFAPVAVTGAYLAFRTGGLVAGGLATLAAIAAVLLVLQLRRRPDHRDAAARVADGAVLALPGGLVIYFGFSAGGFFPGPTAFGALVVVVVLVLRLAVARKPLAGFGWPLGVVGG